MGWFILVVLDVVLEFAVYDGFDAELVRGCGVVLDGPVVVVDCFLDCLLWDGFGVDFAVVFGVGGCEDVDGECVGVWVVVDL